MQRFPVSGAVPNSVGVIPNGLCWLDSRTGTVGLILQGRLPRGLDLILSEIYLRALIILRIALDHFLS